MPRARRSWLLPLGAAALLSAGLAPGALSQTPSPTDHAAHSHGTDRLGKVEFKISCNGAAQAEFNRGMALYHSFVWPAATEAFDNVLRTDPACGMAHWGRAMTILDNPFTWP